MRETATIMVFEKRPRWTPELQRRFLDDDVSVRGADAVADLLRLVESAPPALLVLVLDDAEADCLRILDRLAVRGGRPAIVAVGAERSASLEWPFRELGAVEFLTGRHTAADVARVCRRLMVGKG